MPFSKRIIRNRLQNHINNRIPTNFMTDTEKQRMRLRGNQLIELLYDVRNTNLFTGINIKEYQKEFRRITQVQNAVGGLYNKLINCVSVGGKVFIFGLPNLNTFELTGNEIAMTLFWSYTAQCELVIRLLKQVIDFPLLYKSILNANKLRIKKPSRNTVMLNHLLLLEARFNTNAFIDIDRELRNKISHYVFNYFKGTTYFGIKFKYFDDIGNLREKRYNLSKIMIKNRQISILFHALALTISPSFFDK